jgi:hypothetical protein
MENFTDLLTIVLDLKYSKFINKKCRICIYNGCTKRMNFNYLNCKKALYCKEHKLNDMVDVLHLKCDKCNATRPTFNYEYESKPLYCKRCALPDMIDITSRRCERCKIRQSSFNYETENIRLYCKKCALPGMVDIVNKNKKCKKCKNKIACFNLINKKKAEFCFDCKLDDMTDIKNKKCKLCNFIQPATKFKNMCAGCFYYTNPDTVLARNHKTKENQIIRDLNNELDNIIIQDKIILNGCSRRRPDGLIKLNDYNIIIEIDENQHRGADYSCENKRLMEIFQDLGNSPLTIIRFNPDAYKLENQTFKSLFGITKSDGKLKIINQKEYKYRFNKLLEIVKKNINSIPNKEFNVIQLFYSE